jgi:hypothetical protein
VYHRVRPHPEMKPAVCMPPVVASGVPLRTPPPGPVAPGQRPAPAAGSRYSACGLRGRVGGGGGGVQGVPAAMTMSAWVLAQFESVAPGFRADGRSGGGEGWGWAVQAAAQPGSRAACAHYDGIPWFAVYTVRGRCRPLATLQNSVSLTHLTVTRHPGTDTVGRAFRNIATSGSHTLPHATQAVPRGRHGGRRQAGGEPYHPTGTGDASRFYHPTRPAGPGYAYNRNARRSAGGSLLGSHTPPRYSQPGNFLRWACRSRGGGSFKRYK